MLAIGTRTVLGGRGGCGGVETTLLRKTTCGSTMDVDAAIHNQYESKHFRLSKTVINLPAGRGLTLLLFHCTPLRLALLCVMVGGRTLVGLLPLAAIPSIITPKTRHIEQTFTKTKQQIFSYLVHLLYCWNCHY